MEKGLLSNNFLGMLEWGLVVLYAVTDRGPGIKSSKFLKVRIAKNIIENNFHIFK